MICPTYHADQFAILDFIVLVVVRFISSSHVVLQSPPNPYYLHMKTPSHLNTGRRLRTLKTLLPYPYLENINEHLAEISSLHL